MLFPAIGLASNDKLSKAKVVQQGYPSDTVIYTTAVERCMSLQYPLLGRPKHLLGAHCYYRSQRQRFLSVMPFIFSMRSRDYKFTSDISEEKEKSSNFIVFKRSITSLACLKIAFVTVQTFPAYVAQSIALTLPCATHTAGT